MATASNVAMPGTHNGPARIAPTHAVRKIAASKTTNCAAYANDETQRYRNDADLVNWNRVASDIKRQQKSRYAITDKGMQSGGQRDMNECAVGLTEISPPRTSPAGRGPSRRRRSGHAVVR